MMSDTSIEKERSNYQMEKVHLGNTKIVSEKLDDVQEGNYSYGSNVHEDVDTLSASDEQDSSYAANGSDNCDPDDQGSENLKICPISVEKLEDAGCVKELTLPADVGYIEKKLTVKDPAIQDTDDFFITLKEKEHEECWDKSIPIYAKVKEVSSHFNAVYQETSVFDTKEDNHEKTLQIKRKPCLVLDIPQYKTRSDRIDKSIRKFPEEIIGGFRHDPRESQCIVRGHNSGIFHSILLHVMIIFLLLLIKFTTVSCKVNHIGEENGRNDGFFDSLPIRRLCGKLEYNPDNQICCSGVIHNVTTIVSAMCCGDEMYYDDLAVCLGVPTVQESMAFPCNETISCNGTFLPKLNNQWNEQKKSTREKTVSHKIFSTLPIQWLKLETTINLADFKALSYGKGVRRRAVKHKKKHQEAKHHNQVSNSFGFFVIFACLMALSAVLLDAFLLPIFYATIVKVVLCLSWMTFSTVVLYKLVDEKFIRKEVHKIPETDEAARVTLFERLQVVMMYCTCTCISTIYTSILFTKFTRFLEPHELFLVTYSFALGVVQTSLVFIILSDLSLPRFIDFLKVNGTYSRKIVASQMMTVLQYVIAFILSVKKRIYNVLPRKWFGRIQSHFAKIVILLKCLDQLWMLIKKHDVEVVRDILKDYQPISLNAKKEEKCHGDYSVECLHKEYQLINQSDLTENRSGSRKDGIEHDLIQEKCGTIGYEQLEDKTADDVDTCVTIEPSFNSCDEPKVDGEDIILESESREEFCLRNMCESIEKLGCNGVKSLKFSTELIQELGTEDIYAETSLKTISSESRHSDNAANDMLPKMNSINSNKGLEYCDGDESFSKAVQCTESFDCIQPPETSRKVWTKAIFSTIPPLNESVSEHNSLKSEDSYESIDGKHESSFDTSTSDGKLDKHEFSICSSWSSLSYDRDLMVYSCHGNGSIGNNSVDIKNVGTEHSICNDVTGNHGYNQVGVVKGYFGNSDDSVQNRNVEITPSTTVIDLQKQQESKSTQMSRNTELGDSVDQSVNKDCLKTLVKDTIRKIFKDTIKKLSVRNSRKKGSSKRHSSRHYRRTVRRVLRRTIHHNRNELSPASVNGQVCPATNQLKNNIDNRPLVTTQSGAVAGISLDRPPIALPIPTSSSSLNNYFTKVMVGYNFDLDERMTYEMLRVESFQDLPASCQVSPLRMAKTGFFSRGNGDEVTCFSCGKQYKNWSPTDIPSEVHKRISPNCRMVIDTDPKNVPTVPHTNGYTTHNATQDSLPNNTSGLIQTTHSTVHQDGDVSTSTVPENRPLTRQEIENANDPDRTPVTQQPTRTVLEGGQRRPPQRDQAEELGIVLEKPKYPAYAQLNVRVSTFSGWPGYLDQSPRDMALAGFFYAGYNDYCRCFYCGGGLRNWDAGDDPWVEHARWFSKCSFVRQNRGHRFVEIIMKRQAEMQASGNTGGSRTQTTTAQGTDDASGGSPNTSVPVLPQTKTDTQQHQHQAAAAGSDVNENAIESIRELGYTDQVIRRAIEVMKGNNPGKSKFEATEILEVVFTITDDETTSTNNPVVSENTTNSQQRNQNSSKQKTGSQGRQNGKGKKSQSKAKASNTTNQSISTTEASLPSLSVSSLDSSNAAAGLVHDPSNQAISESDIRSLQEENIQLKEQVMCKICMDKNVSIAFLPCGHLACCIDCAPAMRKCPMCRVFIKGTVKTYLA